MSAANCPLRRYFVFFFVFDNKVRSMGITNFVFQNLSAFIRRSAIEMYKTCSIETNSVNFCYEIKNLDCVVILLNRRRKFNITKVTNIIHSSYVGR